jgi:NAD(P)-dependent dehydrogenase (short-subunit alcohol dehydrogenase family)
MTSTPYQPYASSHIHTQGPGDSRPTAQQILEDCKAIGSLAQRSILITGASSGLGITTAAALYKTGAQLYLTTRDITKMERIIDDIVTEQSLTAPSSFPRPRSVELHMDSFASVREAAKIVKSQAQTLNAIICNAGVMFVPHEPTKDGFEAHLGVNHLAHFLLFQELKQLLILGAAQSKSLSRVVCVSSSGHRFSGINFNDINFDQTKYDAVVAYGQSKTANIYMASTLSRLHKSDGIIGLSLHPGVIMETDVRRYMSAEAVANLHSQTDLRQVKSAEQGVATTVWAAVSPYFEDVSRSGQYLSDVGECSPMDPNMERAVGASGYAAHAYDDAKADRLWAWSCEVVGSLWIIKLRCPM